MATIATQSSGVKASVLETELKAIDAGVLKDIPAKTPMTIDGTAMTPAQIDTQVQSYLATLAAADTAKAQYQTAVVARRNMQVEARNFYLQLKKVVIAYFGAQSAQLADFGLTPAKAKVPKTSAETAIIAAKAKLTREARGTTSKKAKSLINPGVVSRRRESHRLGSCSRSPRPSAMEPYPAAPPRSPAGAAPAAPAAATPGSGTTAGNA
jgi:hypothetical protein